MTAQLLANQVETLFSLPGVLIKLSQLLNSPYVSNGEIGEVIITDPALTARVLQLANSAFPGLSSKIETVSHAIALLGRDALRDLVLATSVTHTFNGLPPELVDMDRFWLNSVACGVIARSLAFRCKLFQSEPFLVAGLLHKVGRLVFYSCCPERYRQILQVGDLDEEAINRAEQSIFGFNHAELGGELLRRWGLPKRLQIAVTYHLSPSRAPCFRKSAALLHVASALACTIESSVSLEEAFYQNCIGFEKGAWNILGLPLGTVPVILNEAWVQAFEIFEILRPNTNPFFSPLRKT